MAKKSLAKEMLEGLNPKLNGGIAKSMMKDSSVKLPKIKKPKKIKW